jgi:hypothetical protein
VRSGSIPAGDVLFHKMVVGLAVPAAGMRFQPRMREDIKSSVEAIKELYRQRW